MQLVARARVTTVGDLGHTATTELYSKNRMNLVL